jgi:circadian clock protein KaiB
MPPDEPRDKSKEYERLLLEQKDARFELRLYVTGLTMRSMEAIDNIKNICEAELQGRYRLEVIDISKRPDLAKDAEILAAPTLIKVLPLPLRRLIGDLSDKERVLVGLDLREKNDEAARTQEP